MLRSFLSLSLGLIFCVSSLANAEGAETPCRGLLLNAESFGFGPTAAIAQVFPRLAGEYPRIGYIGEPHTLGLQKDLPYHEIIPLTANPTDDQIREQLRKLFSQYSHLFTALDFRLARLAQEEGFSVGMYDPLTWFWPTIPEITKKLDVYIAQDFINVRNRLAEESPAFPQNVEVVAPLVQPLRRTLLKDRDGTILVNLGGLSNPFVPDDVLVNFAILLARSGYAAALENSSDIVITTKPEFVERLKSDLRAATFTPLEIQDYLQRSRVAFMTSGLGNLFEASSAGTPVIWLPPTNDSQGQQLELLKSHGMIDWALDWTDFLDEPPLDYFRPQHEVMAELHRRMALVLANGSYQLRLVQAMRAKMDQARNADPQNIRRLIDQFGQGGVSQLAEAINLWALGHKGQALSSRHKFEKKWILGGGLGVRFESPIPFEITADDNLNFAGHWPGVKECVGHECPSDVVISHTVSDVAKITQQPGRIDIEAPWGPKLPPDFVHLVYGAARNEWLRRGLFPVHAACIGNDQDGYDLLVGPPGSGKTSLTLYNASVHGAKVFSGDKTLIQVNADGTLDAIAGTRTITVRPKDLYRWSTVEKNNMHVFGDRVTFELADSAYSAAKKVRIRRVLLVNLNDTSNDFQQLSTLSALHTLYPFFADKQREDVLVGGGDALFDGSVSADIRAQLAARLGLGLQKIPVHRAISSLQNVSAFMARTAQASGDTDTPTAAPLSPASPKKILYGICGIGNGHHSRQLSIVRALLSQGHQIVLLGYGESLDYFRNRFPPHENLQVLEVANPYFVGGSQGLDFQATAQSARNQGVDFNKINSEALATVSRLLGTPDLVISDYEMISAQYANAKGAPLITVDQQSKYLVGDFPQELEGTTFKDEVERLGMFFPVASRRLAVSFFQVPITQSETRFQVEVFPPMIRPEILRAKDHPKSERPSILVYITSQQLGDQPFAEWIKTIREHLPHKFDAHVFLPARMELPVDDRNISFYRHGDPRFDSILISSHGVISTAGHTLLSEAMYLEKPVYALPLALYEQQLNAYMIEKGGFGVRSQQLSVDKFVEFIDKLETYAANIRTDRSILIKTPGNDLLLSEIARMLAPKR